MNRTKTVAALEKAKQYAATLKNDSIDAFRANGGKVIGTFDPEVPFEIFEAAGLLPIGLRGTGATSTEYADKYFKQLTCDFTRAMFNELARGQYDFLDGAVVYNCCDHMRRIDDNWKILPNPKNFHFLYIPKRWEASTYPRFCEEIKALIKSVEDAYGVKITPEKLSAAIAESNFNALLRELIDELKANNEAVAPRRRLMLLAGHAATPQLLNALESQGALIVVDDASNGLRMCAHDISEEGDPLEALCDFYFNVKTPMPRAFPTQERRFETYLKLFDEYRADGIVSARVTMCDLWAFEQYMLANLLRDKDIPSLELEVNYLMDSVGQVRTRVQAFVENLPRRNA